ncbi:hypothetical protein L1987_05527 [Smallanthus sonchifolius]|uniref:Uncharacterized protein n=1 Tax=Smallanthus sonchifolius TaxID=185202 RepID=A0ACB9JVM7_9ASTR|nr:hypothetical protein L1987_05527 [Smallanthus sonchifolius]
MLTLPPQSTLDTLAIGLSPGPMTLVSNFFSDHYPDTDLRYFSQLFNEDLPVLAAQNPPLLYFTMIQDLDSQSDNSKPKYVVSVIKPADDGYKWRKYGQKQVKASELPRSYYKCTHTNCPVTKKIGHFLDGEISDIIYKGQHNHEPPPLHTLARCGAAMDQHTSFEEKPADARQQVNRVTDSGCEDWASSSRVTVVEPKIVVQTRSEVDILDDGFKWRKYGQKVVKGNTYPRSYYKCAYVGCKVRKHVERVYLDPKFVETTYEGKHKHVIPVLAKPSSHKETNFKTERTTLLQLKEEQIPY